MLGFNYLTKQSYLFLMLLLLGSFSLNALSQDVVLDVQGEEVVLSATQIDQVANELDKEAQLEKQDSKVKKALKKVSKSFKNFAKKLKKDEAKDKTKTKKKISLSKILQGVGKGATFVSINTMKPFVNMAGFFTGLFERPGKNEDAKAFLQFFLNHEEELDNAWKNTGTIDNFAVVLQEKVQRILLNKQVIIIKDLVKHYTNLDISDESVLKTLGIVPYAEMASVKNIQEILFEELGPELMYFTVDTNLINEHAEFQELRPLIGDIEGKDFDSLMNITPEFDLLSLGNRGRIQLHEGLIAFSSKIFVPRIVLSLVSKSIASVVTVVGLAADAGMIASTLICTTNTKTKDKMANGDEDMINFCSYVVNKSAYSVSKSRAKGYISGKNFRRTLIKSSGKVERKLRKNKVEKENDTESNLQ